MSWCGAWLKLGEQGVKNGESDRLNWAAVALAVESLDASEQALYDGGLQGCEGLIGVNVEGAH